MPNKSFSIYRPDEDPANKADRLMLEVGNSHLACIGMNKNKISAFELFTFTNTEAADFSKLFTSISADSRLLVNTYDSVAVFINNEYCLPVPVFTFTREIAADYLDIVFGENINCKTQYDHIPIEPGIINVYRIEERIINILSSNFKNVSIKHSWSNILKTVLTGISALPAEFIYVQFYNNFIIAAVVKTGQLQIIQSFIYEAPEDVLYNLLNVTQQFELNNKKLTLQISGMIDLHFTLYRDLITYFANVEVRNADTTKVDASVKEFPLHYFTPFFNLAL